MLGTETRVITQTGLLNYTGELKMEKLIGTVKWFDTKKGFGFIACGGKDYFVHFKAIQGMGFKELVERQTVSFDSKKGDKGLMADNVVVINNGEA